ncbi:MAG: PAS domain-containing protein [Fuerstiella sp.]
MQKIINTEASADSDSELPEAASLASASLATVSSGTTSSGTTSSGTASTGTASPTTDKPVADHSEVGTTSDRAQSLVAAISTNNNLEVDRVFVWLMIAQYLCGIVLALFITPQTWVGDTAFVHLHVWVAVIFGGIVSGLPIYMARTYPGSTATRHTMAVAQAVWSALLIHLSGGRLETHFHVFASLAFIAFYRDWKVVATMTVVVAADHAIRGIWWPLSVYGIATESPWRWVEHAVWVLLEDTVLVFYCVRGKREEIEICRRQVELEQLNAEFEQKVESRTRQIEIEKQKAERLALVARHTDNAVLMLDANGLTEWVNEAFTRITGYELAELLHRRPYEILAGPNTEATCIALMKEGIESKKGFDMIVTKQHKNGQSIIIEIEARPIFDANNQLVQFVQIERDVTAREHNSRERLRLSLELEENAKHLETLALVAQHTSNAVIIADADGKAEWVNDGFTRATGYGLDDVRGSRLDGMLRGPKTSQETLDNVSSCVERQIPFSGEIINYTKQGKPFWAGLQINPVTDDSGQVHRFVEILTNINERKEAEKERERLNKELRTAARFAGRAEVATGVLHNVGNVLNSVNVSVTLLKEKLVGNTVSQLAKGVDIMKDHEDDMASFLTTDPRGRHFPKFLAQVSDALLKERQAKINEVDCLVSNVEHIREIVTAQQSSASRQRMIEPIDIKDLIDSAIKLNDSSLVRHDISIVTQIDELPMPRSEHHELLQILVNLIKNAKEACEDCDSRIVTVSARQEADSICIDVSDSGIGIEASRLGNLFQHGFTTKAGGHGFGLHASAITATELGGSLSANSDGVGCGATFTLRVPLTQVAAPEETVVSL